MHSTSEICNIATTMIENPSHQNLLNLLADINSKWKDIGLALSLPQNFIDGLDEVSNNNNIKLSKVSI